MIDGDMGEAEITPKMRKTKRKKERSDEGNTYLGYIAIEGRRGTGWRKSWMSN